MNARTSQAALEDFTTAGTRSYGRQGPSRAVWEGLAAFGVLVIVTVEALLFLYALGCLPGWELAGTLFTVLASTGGMIYTVLWISQPHGLDGR
ncbi:MAG TPA: hypothetical protein VH640_11845 [Bryobacteraceae bacterium]